jgi:transglutaminase-like putative cysteine protease
MRLHIHHATRYSYTDAAAYSIQHLRLTPRSDQSQQILNWRLSTPGHPRQQRDAHGNTVHTLALNEPHEEIVLIVDGEIETRDEPTLLPRGDGLSPLAYLADSPLATPNEAIAAFALDHFPAGPRREALMSLMLAIAGKVRYQPGATEADHTAAESFALGEGVCQDMAHIFVACCRSLGVPARYVSGYLFTDGEHAASHAWADAWLDDEDGWVSCDITHQRFADGHLCRLAVGRDYLDAGPVRGMRRGGNGESMQVKVVVSDSQELVRVAQQAMQQ